MADPSFVLPIWDVVRDFAASAGSTIARMLLSKESSYSLIGLGVTLGIAAAFTLRRRRSNRAVPLRALLRALLPRRLWRSRSGKADGAFALFNIFVGMMLFGWAIVGQMAVAGWTEQGLAQLFGKAGTLALPTTAVAMLTGIVGFLAYELAYWFDHYLSHKLPILWQFHQVHHSAESLSLATNFRVHPIDTIVFYNLVALFTGVAAGLLAFALGEASAPFLAVGSNVLLLATAVLLTHLHHTHFWITFGERWNRVLLSPAHHQIHHSADPTHHDRNFGNCLAIFDRLFGTLHVPGARREMLRFGVCGLDYDPHSFTQNFAVPFIATARIVRQAAAVRLSAELPSPESGERPLAPAP
jgi:sterol desaturase/sphingolipid hydroxylase (fatty acid hydroxylase superfamily)